MKVWQYIYGFQRANKIENTVIFSSKPTVEDMFNTYAIGRDKLQRLIDGLDSGPVCRVTWSSGRFAELKEYDIVDN